VKKSKSPPAPARDDASRPVALSRAQTNCSYKVRST
jgi:hypothetical protein